MRATETNIYVHHVSLCKLLGLDLILPFCLIHEELVHDATRQVYVDKLVAQLEERECHELNEARGSMERQTGQ